MKLDELDKQVTQADIDELEKFADKVFGKVGIDINFTRHFLDRVNDERNGKPITMSELTRLFKQEQKRWGKKIAQLGPDEEGVMKDLQTDINLPFALRWDSKNNELDLIAKTVMRKSNFRTPNPEFPVESKLPPHLAKHFDKDGDALKGSWKDGEWKADKKQPKKIKTTVKDVTPKGYGPLEEDFGSVPPLAELILMAVVAKTSVDVLIGMFKVALKTGKGLKKLNDLRKRVAKMGQGVADYAMPHESVNEGALTVRKSELHDIIVSMVKDMDFNDTPKLAKIARLLGKEVFFKDGKITIQNKEFDFNEQTTFEATKDELIAKLQDQYKKGHMAHAVHAMRALAQSKGDRHGLSYYAATIARAFSAIDRKELEAAYREKFAEGIIHEDTLTELNILKKKNVGVTQSNPLVVLDKISARNDNKPFPIKFYDGETIEVTPQMARRFMNKYYDDLEPEQREIVDRYIKTKNGFMQAVQKLQISEGWSDKYKKSIDCNNPKGFSQKAHCAGRKKK